MSTSPPCTLPDLSERARTRHISSPVIPPAAPSRPEEAGDGPTRRGDAPRRPPVPAALPLPQAMVRPELDVAVARVRPHSWHGESYRADTLRPQLGSLWPLHVAPPSYDEAMAGRPKPVEAAPAFSLADDAAIVHDKAQRVAPIEREEVRTALPLLIAAQVALIKADERPRRVELWLGGSAAHRALGLVPEDAHIDDLDPLLWVERREDTSLQTLAELARCAVDARVQRSARVDLTYFAEQDRPLDTIALIKVVGTNWHIDLRLVMQGCTRRLFDIDANALLVDFRNADRIGVLPGADAQTALDALSGSYYTSICGLKRDGMVRLWRAHQRGFVPVGGADTALRDAHVLCATLLQHIHKAPQADEAHQRFERGTWINRLGQHSSRPLAPLLSNALMSLAPLRSAHPLIDKLYQQLLVTLRERCAAKPSPSSFLVSLFDSHLGAVGLALWSYVLADGPTAPDKARAPCAGHICIPQPRGAGMHARYDAAVRLALPDGHSFVVTAYGPGTWLTLGAQRAGMATLLELVRLAEEPNDACALAQLLGHPKLCALLPEGALDGEESRLRIARRLVDMLQIAREHGVGPAWQKRLSLAVARIVPFYASVELLPLCEVMPPALRAAMRRIVGGCENASYLRLVTQSIGTPVGPTIDAMWPKVGRHLALLDKELVPPRLCEALSATLAGLEASLAMAEPLIMQAEQQLAAARAHGCEHAQRYVVTRTVPSEDSAALRGRLLAQALGTKLSADRPIELHEASLHRVRQQALADILPQHASHGGMMRALQQLQALHLTPSLELGDKLWGLIYHLVVSEPPVHDEMVAQLLQVSAESVALLWRHMPADELPALGAAVIEASRAAQATKPAEKAVHACSGVRQMAQLWVETAEARGSEMLRHLTPELAPILAQQEALIARLIAVFSSPQVHATSASDDNVALAMFLCLTHWLDSIEHARRWLSTEHLSPDHPLASQAATLILQRPQPGYATLAAAWLGHAVAAHAAGRRAQLALARAGILRVLAILPSQQRRLLQAVDEGQVLIQWLGVVLRPAPAQAEQMQLGNEDTIEPHSAIQALLDAILMRQDPWLSTQALVSLVAASTTHSPLEAFALDFLARCDALVQRAPINSVVKLAAAPCASRAVCKGVAHLVALRLGTGCKTDPEGSAALLEALAQDERTASISLLSQAQPTLGDEASLDLCTQSLLATGTRFFAAAPTFTLRLWHRLAERHLQRLQPSADGSAIHQLLSLFVWRAQVSVLPSTDAALVALRFALADDALRMRFDAQLAAYLAESMQPHQTARALVPLWLASARASAQPLIRRIRMVELLEQLRLGGLVADEGEQGLDATALAQLGGQLCEELVLSRPEGGDEDAHRDVYQNFLNAQLRRPHAQAYLRRLFEHLFQLDPESLVVVQGAILEALSIVPIEHGKSNALLEARVLDVMLFVDAMLPHIGSKTVLMLMRSTQRILATKLLQLGARARVPLACLLESQLRLMPQPMAAQGNEQVDLRTNAHAQVIADAAARRNERVDGVKIGALQDKLAAARSDAFLLGLAALTIDRRAESIEPTFHRGWQLSACPPAPMGQQLARQWAQPHSYRAVCVAAAELCSEVHQVRLRGNIPMHAREQGWPIVLPAALDSQPGALGLLDVFVRDLCSLPARQGHEALLLELFNQVAAARSRALAVGLPVAHVAPVQAYVAGRIRHSPIQAHIDWLTKIQARLDALPL